MIFSDKAIHLALGTLSGEKRSSASKTAAVCSRHLNNNFEILSVMKTFTLGLFWFKNQMAKIKTKWLIHFQTVCSTLLIL